MPIKNIILFISTQSPACRQPVDFVQKTQFPLSIVRLDTQELRQRVMNSKTRPIHKVPTLIINMTDNKFKQYTGPKVMEVLHMLFRKFTQPPPEPYIDGAAQVSDRLHHSRAETLPINKNTAVREGSEAFQSRMAGRMRQQEQTPKEDFQSDSSQLPMVIDDDGSGVTEYGDTEIVFDDVPPIEDKKQKKKKKKSRKSKSTGASEAQQTLKQTSDKMQRTKDLARQMEEASRLSLRG